jgi:hypothetical protein
MSAAALEAVWRVRWSRPSVAIAVTAAILPGIPTVAIDVYNAQDVSNREMGPDFPWTLVITPHEREGLDWIRSSTPTTAVVQTEPYIRGSRHWAYIPAFAERRSAAGLPGSMTPIRPYREAADDVYWNVFRSRSPEEAFSWARHLGIDYLVLGKPERRAYATSIGQMASRPDLFQSVFRNDEMTIFRVVPAPSGSGQR